MDHEMAIGNMTRNTTNSILQLFNLRISCFSRSCVFECIFTSGAIKVLGNQSSMLLHSFSKGLVFAKCDQVLAHVDETERVNVCWIASPRVNFINVFTRSFYTPRSQKRKKLHDLTVFFALLGSAGVTAARKMLLTVEMTCLRFSKKPVCERQQNQLKPLLKNIY